MIKSFSRIPHRRTCTSRAHREAGFTLIELLIVMAVIGILVGYAISRNAGNAASTGGGDRALEEVERRLSERHDAAIRLNQITAPTSLENYTAPPVDIDFGNPSTTVPLMTEGVDANSDGLDDNTGTAITRLNSTGSGGSLVSWRYSYENSPQLSLPTGWQIATSQSQLGSIPLIGGGTSGRGVLATQIGFDGKGRAYVRDGTGQWSSLPSGSDASSSSVQSAPFWVVYVVFPSGTQSGSTPLAAAAISIHPTGQLERWRWDGSQWKGFRRRTLS